MSRRPALFHASLLALAAGCSALALTVPTSPALAQAKPAATAEKPVHIPYEMFTLDNGLRVVVHTDRKAPVVAVHIWYHVGSKDERPGRTGFAHLFEHLMFQGTENYSGEWFEPLEKVGATDLNGTTWLDRTNYFQTVPTTALEMTLWLESDRMGHFIDSVTQAKLDEQRGVVQNEKRQGENRPYGRLFELVQKGLFPEGHPYSWTTIGSLEDLDAASLDDVKEWFRTYYGPDNSVLVLAGDIDMATAKPLVEKYFGGIAVGPPLPRREAAIPVRLYNTRDTLEDRVPQALLDRSWAVPGRSDRESVLLTLAAQVLGGGKTSRLYEALVYDKQLATNASSSVLPFQLASMFGVDVLVKPGTDLKAAEAEMESVVAKFLTDGPTPEELERAKTVIRADFIRGIEKVGGFGGKGTFLAEGALYHDDPGFYRTWLAWMDSATPAEVKAAAAKWLGTGWHQVDVLPVPTFKAGTDGADRSKLPVVDATPDLTYPTIEEGTLKNGVKVSLARRTGLPVVEIALMFDAGFAADSSEKPGVASFALDMMDEGTKTRSSLQIAAEREGLGAEISTGSTLDTSTARLSALKDKLTPSLALFADIVRNPAFAAEEMERLRPRRIAGIQQEKANPQALAFRLLPPALYGRDHAYGKPFSGSGTEASIGAMTADDLKAFHASWIRPDNMRILAAGDVTMAELTAALEKAFGDWKAPRSAVPAKNVAEVKLAGPRVALIDRPDAPQTMILAGRLAPPTTVENDIALGTANDVFGGLFNSRVNLNLREDKGWSYGAFSFMQDARGQRPWIVLAPVQTDKTAESLAEIRKELAEYVAARPATADETLRAVQGAVRSLPGQFETNGAVLGQMLSDARFGRPLDYITTVKPKYEAMTPATVLDAAKDLVRGEDLLWVIIGDRKKIEQSVRDAGLGPVEFWDSDGNKLP